MITTTEISTLQERIEALWAENERLRERLAESLQCDFCQEPATAIHWETCCTGQFIDCCCNGQESPVRVCRVHEGEYLAAKAWGNHDPQAK